MKNKSCILYILFFVNISFNSSFASQRTAQNENLCPHTLMGELNPYFRNLDIVKYWLSETFLSNYEKFVKQTQKKLIPIANSPEKVSLFTTEFSQVDLSAVKGLQVDELAKEFIAALMTAFAFQRDPGQIKMRSSLEDFSDSRFSLLYENVVYRSVTHRLKWLMGVMPISVEEQAQLIDLYLYHEAHNEENFPLAFWNSFLGSLPAAGVSRSKKVISIPFVINYLNAKIDVLQANPKLSGLNFYSTGPNTRAYEFKFQIENIFKKLFLPKLQSIVLKSWKEAITEELDSNLDLDNLRLIVKGKTQPNHHSLQNEVIIQLRKNLLSHGIYSSLEFNLDLLFDYNFLSNVTSAQ